MHIQFVSTFIRIKAKHKLPRATDAYSNNYNVIKVVNLCLHFPSS